MKTSTAEPDNLASGAPRGAMVLRLAQVKAKTGLSRATIYAQQAAGLFPPSFSLGERAVGWMESEVDAVIIARAAGAGPAVIKALIESLVTARGRHVSR